MTPPLQLQKIEHTYHSLNSFVLLSAYAVFESNHWKLFLEIKCSVKLVIPDTLNKDTNTLQWWRRSTSSS